MKFKQLVFSNFYFVDTDEVYEAGMGSSQAGDLVSSPNNIITSLLTLDMSGLVFVSLIGLWSVTFLPSFSSLASGSFY